MCAAVAGGGAAHTCSASSAHVMARKTLISHAALGSRSVNRSCCESESDEATPVPSVTTDAPECCGGSAARQHTAVAARGQGRGTYREEELAPAAAGRDEAK